jgi:Spy/CpxP family protein refolding chaperone
MPRSLFALFAVPFAILLAACSAGTNTAPAASGTTQQAIATQDPGPLRAVGLALGEVPLAADQRTKIEALFHKVEARHLQARTESAAPRKELLLTLATQVEAGTIDRAALAPKIEATATAFRKAREEDRAALVELHASLTPDQRKAFVDAFEPQTFHKAFEGHPMKERFGKWKELNLTAEQRDKLKDAMRAEFAADKHGGKEMFKARMEHGKKALEAFKNDQFTGADLFPDHATQFIEHMLRFAEIATPILTPEQRTKAAEMLRERAATDLTKP